MKSASEKPSAPAASTPRTDELRRELYRLKSNTLEYPCEQQLTELCRQLERELLQVGAALNEQNERWGLYGNESQAALRFFKVCGCAERWEGHDDLHKFTSLADLLRTLI